MKKVQVLIFKLIVYLQHINKMQKIISSLTKNDRSKANKEKSCTKNKLS